MTPLRRMAKPQNIVGRIPVAHSRFREKAGKITWLFSLITHTRCVLSYFVLRWS